MGGFGGGHGDLRRRAPIRIGPSPTLRKKEKKRKKERKGKKEVEKGF